MVYTFFCIFAENYDWMMTKRTLLFMAAGLLLATAAWGQRRVATLPEAYCSPVIAGFHPDPSVCRVGDDYYLVNSSFEYFPGVPIYHSRDLTNWEQIGNVLGRESQLPLKGSTSWLGIYAPTIRYHEGTYYMITTNVGNGGNFMVTATDPRGPWSEPIWLEQQGIDPSLWFDEESGKCYMVSNPDNTITLCEIDPKTGRQLTESRPIWQGTGGRYPEGPHIYRKDGYYYLLISEGGTELAHSLTIARSRKIEGPYVANPDNPLLTHCSMAGQGNQVQGTGHGDLVEAKDGSWWMVLLAYRNFGGSYHHLGRETFLTPVEWKKGQWPVIKEESGKRKVEGGKKRHVRSSFVEGLPASPEWIHVQNTDSTMFGIREGRLQLVCSRSSLTDNDRPTFVARRQECERMVAETHLSFEEGLPRDEAGLTVYQIHDGHADLCLSPSNDQTEVVAKVRLKGVEAVLGRATIEGYEAWLRVSSDGERYTFEYATDGKTFRTVGSVECSLLSTEVVGGFTGVVVGMYATGANTAGAYGKSFALFDYFDYVEN